MPLPEWPLLAAFISASLLLAVTPGPGVLYVVGRSAAPVLARAGQIRVP